MNLLFLFMDGIGLGENDPSTNPFTGISLPTLQKLLGNRNLSINSAPFVGDIASLLAIDANLNVQGLPQSATGQAVILTGKNIPGEIGYHYGPKPNPEVAQFIKIGNLFCALEDMGLKTGLLNAYPPSYFEAIKNGRRLYSAIPLAVKSAGIALRNDRDLINGQAISADFTGQGWREHLGYDDIPVISPYEAGKRLAQLSSDLDFAFFEYWLSDYAGHRQDLSQAKQLLISLDQVLNGLIDSWSLAEGLILITSDHGNMEDLSTRRHTSNPVPAILIGDMKYRSQFADSLHDLTDIYPAIVRFFQPPHNVI
jgi:hypothetical protein